MALAAASASAQVSRVAAIREEALHYTGRLPDFICTQVTHRNIDYTGAGETFEPVDFFEERLSYFDRREHYRLISINGKAPDAGTLGFGATSNGEFGSMLHQVFDPRTQAEFGAIRSEILRARPVDVFSFKIAKKNSAAALQFARQRVIVGYHGEVYADRQSHSVVRLVVYAEAPRHFPLQDVSHVLDYEWVPLPDGEFLLPLHSEMRARAPEESLRDAKPRLRAREVMVWNQTDFTEYRKYSADSKITFGK